VRGGHGGGEAWGVWGVRQAAREAVGECASQGTKQLAVLQCAASAPAATLGPPHPPFTALATDILLGSAPRQSQRSARMSKVSTLSTTTCNETRGGRVAGAASAAGAAMGWRCGTGPASCELGVVHHGS
jgi:hypothetical protein